jgi:thiopeptide-type bacteriocin biosynthesis protein
MKALDMEKTRNTDDPLEIDDTGFFVLRTPLLPIEELSRWSENLSARAVLDSGADAETVREAWREDVATLRAGLRKLIERPEILQALFVASPTLESSLRYWAREPDSKKGLQAERSLVRYFARMCGRSTPFGLFSGCTMGRIAASGDGRETDLTLAPRAQYRPSSRLDFDYLFALTAGLRADPSMAGQLRYWPNSSLRRVGDAWHYVESRGAGSYRSHHLVKLYNDGVLESVLRHAGYGATIGELVEEIRLEPDGGAEITAEEAESYVRELIRSEVLISSLTPLVTGALALDDIIAQLEALPAGRQSASVLAAARRSMAELDGKGLGAEASGYRAIADKLKSLPAELDIAKLFQVDMIKPALDACLSGAVFEQIVNAVDILCRVGLHGEWEELRTFREAFRTRYDRAWVPLEQALDEELGVGFGSSLAKETSPLLKGIQIPGAPDRTGPTPVDLQALLRSRVLEQTSKNVAEIVLDPKDLPGRNPVAGGLPGSFDVQFSIMAPSLDAVRQGDFRIWMHGHSGPPGVRMLGRFCHLDPELDAGVREHLRKEEAHDPEAVYAEVVYLPEGRLGNVLCRPVLRDYEITYLGRSGAEPERQIPISDLLVSVAPDGTIQLFSQRLRKRVIARLTNAHGFLNPNLPPVYRFLCYLQRQHAPGSPIFTWGPLDAQKTLPRLRVGRVVLACARWKLDADELKALENGDRCASFVAVQKLRQSRGLPRWVLLVEADNSLPVDLDNPLSVDAMVHVLKRTKAATIQEMYPPPDDLCVAGQEGHFHHEIVLPVVRRRKTEAPNAKFPEQRGLSVAGAEMRVASTLRTLPPCGEWLYVKLYGGPSTLDDLLASEIALLLRSALQSEIVSRWFFIRYADPQQHLRLRFQMPSEECQTRLLALVSKVFHPLLAEGRIWKIQFDTYEREIERYGGPVAALTAEDVFCADSQAVLEVLQSLDGDAGLDMRWRIALLGIDRLLADFGFDLAQRRAAIERMRDGYHTEFRVGSATKKQLGDRFRAERRRLESLFEDSATPSAAADIAGRAFGSRSSALIEAVRRFRSLDEAGSLQTPIHDLLSSFVHMHVNRMMPSAQRVHEMVLCDFLYRIYDGQLARAGNTAGQEDPSETDTKPVEAGVLR